MSDMIYLLVLTIGVWNLAISRSSRKRTLLSLLTDGLHMCLAGLFLTLQYLSPDMSGLMTGAVVTLLVWGPFRNLSAKKDAYPLHHR